METIRRFESGGLENKAILILIMRGCLEAHLEVVRVECHRARIEIEILYVDERRRVLRILKSLAPRTAADASVFPPPLLDCLG